MGGGPTRIVWVWCFFLFSLISSYYVEAQILVAVHWKPPLPNCSWHARRQTSIFKVPRQGRESQHQILVNCSAVVMSSSLCFSSFQYQISSLSVIPLH